MQHSHRTLNRLSMASTASVTTEVGQGGVNPQLGRAAPLNQMLPETPREGARTTEVQGLRQGLLVVAADETVTVKPRSRSMASAVQAACLKKEVP